MCFYDIHEWKYYFIKEKVQPFRYNVMRIKLFGKLRFISKVVLFELSYIKTYGIPEMSFEWSHADYNDAC